MTNELTKPNQELITFDDDKVGLIKRTVAKGATDDELELFLHQCKRTGLDPLARQIYFQKYNTKNGPQIAIITGIDGYRLVAARTGIYAGNDEPVFEGKKQYQGVGVPVKATVTVWKIVGGVRCPFSASVYWDEYCPLPPKDYQWKKMPHVMLAKCAEAAALRKAFPADLGTVYTNEEMQQADFVTMQDIDNYNQDIFPDADLDDAIDVEAVEVQPQPRKVQKPQPQKKGPQDDGRLFPANLADFAKAFAEQHDRYDNNIHVVNTLKKELDENIGVNFTNYAESELISTLENHAEAKKS